MYCNLVEQLDPYCNPYRLLIFLGWGVGVPSDMEGTEGWGVCFHGEFEVFVIWGFQGGFPPDMEYTLGYLISVSIRLVFCDIFGKRYAYYSPFEHRYAYLVPKK